MITHKVRLHALLFCRTLRNSMWPYEPSWFGDTETNRKGGEYSGVFALTPNTVEYYREERLSRMPSHFQLQPGSSDHKTGECDEFTHISETNGMHWWCHILKQGALYQAWENYFLLLLFLHFILFFSYECLSVFTPLRRTRNVYIEVLIWKQPDWLIGFQGVLRQKQRWTWKCSRSGRRMNSNCVTEFGWRLALKVNILVQEWTHWTMSNGNQD